MFIYKAYGLVIVSDAPMPELPASDAIGTTLAPRVRVSLRRTSSLYEEPRQWISTGVDPEGKTWFRCAKVERGFILRFTDLADFFASADGREIALRSSAPGLTITTIRHLVLDQVFPRLLSLLGHESLHATAVATDHGACAFIGPPGVGKSTIAASFQLEGFGSVCDDCLVLRETPSGISATPGYPGLRLWPDALDALSVDPRQAVRVAEYSSKFRLLGEDTARRFITEPKLLLRLYLLARSESDGVDQPQLHPLTPAEVFPELVRASFPLDVTDQTMLARHFKLFSRLAREVPARRLIVPNRFSRLPEVRRSVLADLAN